MKILKIVFTILIAFVVVIAILLIVSIFPIAGNYKVMVVQSGSMEPAIKTGGIVVVKPANEYKIGDIITFKNPNSPKISITHRIYDIKVENNQTVYVTKGDANNGQDQGEVLQKNVVGKVLFSIPYVGYAVATARKPYGFMLLIIVPALVIIYDQARKIYEEIKKKQKNE